MAFSNKELSTGDILQSGIGEMYLYLGYYEGQPHSFYNMPNRGHLYLYIGNKVEDFVSWSSEKQASYVEDELLRFRVSFDGNAAYTKRYKYFDNRIGHVDMSPFMDRIMHPWGLDRLGGKEQGVFKEKEREGDEPER